MPSNPQALGADSPIVKEVSFTSGAGSIVVSGTFRGNWFRFNEVYDSGTTVAVVVDDDSGQKEAFFAQFQAPDTLVPQIMIISSNGNAKISWPDTGQRIVKPMLGVVPPDMPTYLPGAPPITSLPGACLCPAPPVIPPPPAAVTVPCDCPLHPTLWATCGDGNQFGVGQLSDGGLTITDSLSNPGTIYTCGASYSSGKKYFELEYRPGAIPDPVLWLGGIVNSQRVPIPGGTTYVGSDTLGVGVGKIYAFGVFFNAGTGFSPTASLINSPMNFGDWLGFAVDISGRWLWVKNISAGGGWNPLYGGGDPATGAGGFPIPNTVIDGTNPILIAWSGASNAFSPNEEATLNVGVTPFQDAIPTGYDAWDPNP